MNELTIDGKQYISSKKAAEITGYAKDYVGQLCREGHVEARMVGRSWYVLETSIRAHRFGGDPHAESLESEKAAEPEEIQAPNAWGTATYVPDMAPSMAIPTISRSEEGVEEPAAGEAISTAETLTDMQAAWKEWFAQKQDTLIETPEIIDAREEEHEREAEIEEDIEEFKAAHHAEDPEEISSAEEEPVLAQDVNEDEIEAVPIVSMPAAVQQQYEEIEEESEPVVIHHAAPIARYAPMAEEATETVLSKKERKQAMLQARKARKARARNGFGPAVVRAILIAVILLTVAVLAIGTGFAERYVKGNTLLLPIFDYLGGTSTISK